MTARQNLVLARNSHNIDTAVSFGLLYFLENISSRFYFMLAICGFYFLASTTGIQAAEWKLEGEHAKIVDRKVDDSGEARDEAIVMQLFCDRVDSSSPRVSIMIQTSNAMAPGTVVDVIFVLGAAGRRTVSAVYEFPERRIFDPDSESSAVDGDSIDWIFIEGETGNDLLRRLAGQNAITFILNGRTNSVRYRNQGTIIRTLIGSCR